MAMTLTFDGGKATGTAAMGGPAQPIAVDTGGPLFADGPGAFRSIAALPLKDGYTATFRNFDPMKRKAGAQAGEGGRRSRTSPFRRGRSRRGRSRSSPRTGSPAIRRSGSTPPRAASSKDHRDAAGDGWRGGDDGTAEVGSRTNQGPAAYRRAPDGSARPENPEGRPLPAPDSFRGVVRARQDHEHSNAATSG